MANFQFGGYIPVQKHSVHLVNCSGCYFDVKGAKQHFLDRKLGFAL